MNNTKIDQHIKFNTQNIESDVLPGASELCNGIWIYNNNSKEIGDFPRERMKT